MARYQTHQVDIPLTMGMSQEYDNKTPPARLTDLENLEYDKRNRLVKRAGTALYTLNGPSGSALSGTTRRLDEYEDRPVYVTRNRIYDLSQDIGRCSDRGPFPHFGYPVKTAVARDADSNHVASATVKSGNYIVHCWIAAASTSSTTIIGELWAAVYTADGTQLFRSRLATNAQKPRLVERASNASVILWWADGAGAPYTLKYALLTTSSTPTAWGAATAFTGAIITANCHFDVSHIPGTGIGFVTYYDGAQVVLKRVDAAIATTNTVNIIENGDSGIGVETDGTNVAVGWSNATPLTRGAIYGAAALAGVVAPLTLQAHESWSIGWTKADSTTWDWVLGQENNYTASGIAFAIERMQLGQLTNAGVSTAGQALYWLAPASRPWRSTLGDLYIVGHYGDELQLEAALYVVALPVGSPPAYWAKMHAVLLTGGLASIRFLAPARAARMALNGPHIDSSGYLYFAWPELFRIRNTGIVQRGSFSFHNAGTSSWVFAGNLDAVDADVNTTTLENVLYYSGGVVTQYDGDVAAEVGYAWTPARSGVATAGVGNTWSYCFTYAWYDKQGKLHESAPSAPVTLTNVGTVTFELQTLTLTNKNDPVLVGSQKVAIRAYRTTTGGSSFRYLGEVANSVVLPTVTMSNAIAGVADSAIAAQPVVYTDMRLLPFGWPIAAKDVCTWDNRVVAASGERAIMSTRAAQASAPCWVDHASHVIETHDGESLVAVEAIDDTLVLFQDNAVYAVQGTGPAQFGSPVLPEPRRLDGHPGCIAPASVLSTPGGIGYQSDRGLELLPRGFGTAPWFGEPVRDVTDVYNVVRGACRNPVDGRAIWLCFDESNLDTRFVVWDWAKGTWHTYANNDLDENEMVPSGPIWSAASAFDGLVVAQPTPVLYVPVTTGLELGGHFSGMLQTNHIPISGFYSGAALLSSIRLKGHFMASNVRVILSLAYDGGTYTETKIWDLTGSVGTELQLDYSPARHRMNSIRLLVQDSSYNGVTANAGVAWNSITLVVAEKRLPNPLTATFRG